MSQSYLHVPSGKYYIFEDHVVDGMSSYVRADTPPEEVTAPVVKSKALKSTSSKEGNK